MTRETVCKAYISKIFYSFVHAKKNVKFYIKFLKN